VQAELPLAGCRVLDMATVLAAPVAATMLGDFGAEVVKIEEPGRGDFTRQGPGSSGPGGRSWQWIQEGRNKKSVTIDLRTSRGQQLVKDLLPHFDVIVTNYRPPTLEKWGLSPETLRELHPDAVVVCVTGYGLTGPYRERGAFDRIASAFSGLTYVSGDPAEVPVRAGYAVIDYCAAYMAAFAVVSCLYHRDVHGGTGQIVDLALYEAGFRASESALVAYSQTGQVRERAGNRNPFIVPASDFDTKDGRRVSLHAGTDQLFRRLAAVMGRGDLAVDARFAEAKSRVAHQDELYGTISAWASERDADEIITTLNDAGVPASAIMSIADIADNPHYIERGTFGRYRDAEHGELAMVDPMPKLSETPGRIRHLGPALGADTGEILGGLLGLDEEAISELRADGVV
jgi:crotonobetainyl-CoA:carnitine CoA-transferase CaiB-like acyl-CoA transferase